MMSCRQRRFQYPQDMLSCLNGLLYRQKEMLQPTITCCCVSVKCFHVRMILGDYSTTACKRPVMRCPHSHIPLRPEMSAYENHPSQKIPHRGAGFYKCSENITPSSSALRYELHGLLLVAVYRSYPYLPAPVRQ